MKVKPEHYAVLHDTLRPVITSKAFADYRERLREDSRVKDPEMRARWDALWAVSSDLPPSFIGVLYEYCNDDHIDTALRAIVRELTAN